MARALLEIKGHGSAFPSATRLSDGEAASYAVLSVPPGSVRADELRNYLDNPAIWPDLKTWLAVIFTEEHGAYVFSDPSFIGFSPRGLTIEFTGQDAAMVCKVKRMMAVSRHGTVMGDTDTDNMLLVGDSFVPRLELNFT